MEKIVVEEIRPIFGAKITAIGVGGGGSNAISNLADSVGIHQYVKIVAANTDKQHLDGSPAPYKIRLGEELTKGLGAGMRPEIGEASAQESEEQIKEVLDGSDIVFIATGLGGGTGTGASPVIARIAKELGALTVSIVTKPFKGEGPKKAKLAEGGLAKLREVSDSIIVVPNDRLRSVISPTASIRESFKTVDDVLVRAVSGIANVMLNYGPNNMNVDFADVRTVMGHKGLALMGIGEAEGQGAASAALREALTSPLLDNVSIEGAMGILVNFECGEDYPFCELEDAMNLIYEYVHEDADVKYGTISSEGIQTGQVRVTIIATGFEKETISQTEKESFREEKQKQEAIRSMKNEIDIRGHFESGRGYQDVQSIDLDYPAVIRKNSHKPQQ